MSISRAFRVTKNFFALLLSTGVQRLSNFFLTLYIARVLGADALGQFTIVMSLVLIFQTIASMGQQHIAVREVARAPQDLGSYLLNGSLVVVLGGLVCTFLMLVTAHLIGYEDQLIQYVYIASASLIPGVLAVVAQSVLQGCQKMHYITAAQTLSSFVKLVLSLGLLYFGFELSIVFWVIILSNIILYASYLWMIGYKFSLNDISLDTNKIYDLLSMAGTFIVISIFGVVFKQVDTLMLGRLRDPESVGIYSAAFRMIQIGMQLLPSFMLALFPYMSEVHVTLPENLGMIAERVLRLLLVLIIPVATVSTILADDILLLVYGSGYEKSVPILRILVWMLVLFFVNAVLYRTMLASDNEHVTMRVAGVNMIVSIMLNLFFIPRWGAVGVAVVSLVTTLIAVIQNYSYIARNLFHIRWWRLVGKPVAAALLSGGLLYMLRSWSPLLSPFLAVGAYSVLVFIFKVFPDEDIRFVRRAWQESVVRIS